MEKDLINSLRTSIINSNIESNENYQYKLISNNEEKIVSILRKHFETCDEFIISVAFITTGGLSLFLEQLKTLEEKNIKGKILTGYYLNFTEPKALKKLLQYKNIDLKIATHKKFHPKAYFFRKDNIWTLIVGSSNLTQAALTVNFEWNLLVTSLENGKIVKDILEKFNNSFSSIKTLTNKGIENYQEIYTKGKELFNSLPEISEIGDTNEIKPNLMQKKALENLKRVRKEHNKTLIISATGTGKTYLAAFDIKNSKAKKILFVAHRKIILEKSMASFKKVMPKKTMGIFKNGTTASYGLVEASPQYPKQEKSIYNFPDNKDIDITFAMIQTISKNEYLHNLPKDFFDYIIIDEVHHSGAKSYQNILNYFEPKFLLGLTATPERTDNFDIYKLFDYNIAYEIRLYEAMNEELLCPFHYFGVSDILINGESLNENSTIGNLTSDERVRHILEKSSYYGYSGNKLHALIFVSRVEEAEILCNKFLEKGLKAAYLSSKNSDSEREKTIEHFEKGEIEYLFSVDLFNEGIDIPCINQIILLRPTKSSIVYIQQLGRGLRKHKNKDFTIILDFIGNYSKNFLIPIAISQNSSYDKDFMKRFLMNSTDFLPGESSVIFDKISKDRIFENINKINFSNKKLIEENFRFLEKQLGRFPLMTDFFEKNLLAPSIILKYKKNYDEILKLFVSSKEIGALNDREKSFLNFLSSFFTPAKRIHETIILKYILLNTKISFEEISKILEKDYSLKAQKDNIDNAFKHLTKEIFMNLSTTKSFEPVIYRENNFYYLNNNFKEAYLKNSYFKLLIDDLIEYNLKYYFKNYSISPKHTEENLILFREYSKQEAFWYSNLDFNNGYQVSGYTAFEKEKILMIFITLDGSNSRNIYTNEFYDTQSFSWFSKSSRYLTKNNKMTIEGKIANNFYTIKTFIKKINGENFYYVGDVERVLSAQATKDIHNKPNVKYIFKLKNEIKKELFEYFLYN